MAPGYFAVNVVVGVVPTFVVITTLGSKCNNARKRGNKKSPEKKSEIKFGTVAAAVAVAAVAAVAAAAAVVAVIVAAVMLLLLLLLPSLLLLLQLSELLLL